MNTPQVPLDPSFDPIRRARTARSLIMEGLISSPPPDDPEVLTSEILQAFSVPTHLGGYRYLRHAIIMTATSPELLRSVTKTLYPDIANAFHVSAVCVERSMRNALSQSWDRCNAETIGSFFGTTSYGRPGRPTVGEFISCISDTVRLLTHNTHKKAR